MSFRPPKLIHQEARYFWADGPLKIIGTMLLHNHLITMKYVCDRKKVWRRPRLLI